MYNSSNWTWFKTKIEKKHEYFYKFYKCNSIDYLLKLIFVGYFNLKKLKPKIL